MNYVSSTALEEHDASTTEGPATTANPTTTERSSMAIAIDSFIKVAILIVLQLLSQ